MGHSSKNLEDRNAEINADSISLAHEVSEGNKDSLGTELEVSNFTFWQRTQLHSTRDLKTRKKLNSKAGEEESLRQRSIRLWHDYRSQHLSIFSRTESSQIGQR